MFGEDLSERRHGTGSWRQPFHWWGPPWNRPPRRTLAQLLDLEMLSDQQAAWLVTHLREGGSVIVAASPQGAGKSTLADALINELPADRLRVFIRGMYESFEWVIDTEPGRATLLVNEISPHLPIYAWGQTVRRLLALGEAGYQIISTLHADSIEETIAQLATYPIHATTSQLAALDVVVFITVTVAGDNVGRRVGSIVALSRDESTGGLIVQPVAE